MSDRDAPAMAERAGYDAALEVCQRLDHPELEAFAWIGYGTTVDQARIEDALDAIGLHGSEQILHVGTGESSLAKRFASRVRLVDGLTLNAEEKRLADSLGIPNYTVRLLSKYSREFLLEIEHRYDYIVDNNLASYVCCKYHFHRMLDNYVWCLRRGGRILTDQRGMDFSDGDPRFRLTYDDLVVLGHRFSLRVAAVTDTVYELRRAESEQGPSR